MTQTNNILLFIFTAAVLLLSNPVMAQKCTGKQQSSDVVTTQSVAINKGPQKRTSIDLPPNYRPPVANDKLITFPETEASRKKQKKLLKKRQKISRRKKGKKQGCAATRL